MLPFFIYIIFSILIVPLLLTIKLGPSTEEQINTQFENSTHRDYELLILGNSRNYRGLNPSRFNLSTYNFSHDNDSYNQMYYKLIYLLEKDVSIKYLLVGIDYFQFSFKAESRNYVYGRWFDSTYLKDFDKSIYSYNIVNIKSSLHPRKLLPLFEDRSKGILKDNGQYILPDVAKKNDHIDRDINRLVFQEKYFEKIIETCKSKNILVFMVMLPLRENEIKSYSKDKINSFNTFIDSYANGSEVFYINYSELEEFSYVDYTDITHLNEDAANRISIKLNNEILWLINSN